MQGLRDAFVRPLRGRVLRPLHDRADAGRQLAATLSAYAGRQDVLVLGLPRGGVPVAYEIAKALHAPLDIFVVRKLGVPGQEELAFGALASDGMRVLNDEIVHALALADDEIETVVAREQREIERRERTYRGDRPLFDVQGKTVILVDDGVATGATLRAALAALRARKPAKIIAAVGVAPVETCETLAAEVDELVCLLKPDPFWAVGLWFADFSPTTDEEVRTLLAQADDLLRTEKGEQSMTTMHTMTEQPIEHRSVQIAAGGVMLAGDLSLPQGAKGLVLFAHGSGSSRFSPRNRSVAQVLQAGGLGTLLFDLLTTGEEELDLHTRHLRFDIPLLANRLVATTDWVLQHTTLQHLKIGYFGASTGAAAALIAATQRPEVVAAVVSRGGRPDLALPVLAQVKVPTLLIVGGNDQPVIRMNEQALAQLRAEAKLAIVPGASHLFEEPGTLETVARLACDWFQRYLTAD
jgi:putative phosphoribosyl transferase